MGAYTQTHTHTHIHTRYAEAFLSGGKEAELQVREIARQEKKEAERRSRLALRRTLAGIVCVCVCVVCVCSHS